MKAGIYIIKNTVTEKLYVGSTNNFSVRWKRHVLDLNRGNHTGLKLQRAWLKYGEAAFQFLVIEYVADTSLLMEREQHWLDTLRCVELGYNVLPTAGSNRGYKLSKAHKAALSFAGNIHSEESKRKMSLAAQNRVVSEQTKEKMRNFNLGKTKSPEMKAKMRAIALARPPMSTESREKISVAKLGKQLSEETKLKMSASQKGKVYSEETKLRLSIAATKAHARRKALQLLETI